MNAYEKLVGIADGQSRYGYLRSYRTDLTVHDQRTIGNSKQGDRFLWLIRECGTELFPVGTGMDPIWATYWLDKGNSRSVPVLPYLVTMGEDGDGTVQAVGYDRVIELANEPRP